MVTNGHSFVFTPNSSINKVTFHPVFKCALKIWAQFLTTISFSLLRNYLNSSKKAETQYNPKHISCQQTSFSVSLFAC